MALRGRPAHRSRTQLAEHARGETHGLALELATQPHAKVADAAAELRSMRAGLAATVRSLGLRAAVAGTHPLVKAEDVEVSPGARYQFLHQSLRELARREPTFALHVHVAVPDPELAVRALNGIRAHIPVLLALSANSPFTRGRDSGLASARTPVFQAFPRTGIPREFGSYAEYVEAIDILHPLRRDPRADVHLVGRAPAAEARHARGAGDGRADADPRHGRAGRAGPVPRALRGARRRAPSRSSRTRPRCSTRTASSPRATASTRSCSTRTATAACPPPGAWRRSSTPAGRTRARWAASASWQLLAHLAGDPGATRQRAIASEPAGLRGLLHTLQAEFSPPRPQLALAA